MSSSDDWNAQVIAEFRANGGRVGGNFEGAPMALVHHRGRRTGRAEDARKTHHSGPRSPTTLTCLHPWNHRDPADMRRRDLP
ncbi:nitroreductase/quinone reductase family protein [Rhodococcus pyridinivorans]|uniref:nitroreductase/quinone reductase family protein n=1 Tax=Rhodococcus pyridinivorans TaxID=103816 RepID=UPI003F4DF6D2